MAFHHRCRFVLIAETLLLLLLLFGSGHPGSLSICRSRCMFNDHVLKQFLAASVTKNEEIIMTHRWTESRLFSTVRPRVAHDNSVCTWASLGEKKGGTTRRSGSTFTANLTISGSSELLLAICPVQCVLLCYASSVFLTSLLREYPRAKKKHCL